MTSPVYKHAESMKTKLARAHKRRCIVLGGWCNEHGFVSKTYEEADPYDICVISRSDYDLQEFRKDIASDNDSRFLDPTAYEEWNNE